VTIFINGKPSLLMRKNSAAILQQMLANAIERIEVITNPSARYKPDGVGGIINIVLKKESRAGLNGMAMANVGNLDRYNANLTMNYHPGKVNLFGSYGFRRNNNPRFSTNSRIQKDSTGQVINYYDNTSSSSSRPTAHIGNLGLDYAISENSTFGIAGNYFFQDSYHKQNSQTIFRDGMQNVTSNFTTSRTNDEYEKEYEMSSTPVMMKRKITIIRRFTQLLILMMHFTTCWCEKAAS
jgi:outer membrane receptor for ferrienterochelin and colicin